MKAKTNPFLSISSLALASLLGLSASAMAQYSWNIGSNTWDTSTANWIGTGTTWVNGGASNAVFSNTNAATTITLSSGLTAGSVTVGNGGNNANYTFSSGSLSATRFTVQANGSNNLGTLTIPTTTLNNTSLSLTGDLGVGRATLVIGGNSTVTADRIGGAGMTGISSADWGQVTIQDTANVTASNGIVGGTTAWGLNLNGGTLTTRGIDYGPHSFSGTTNLNFNGTLVKANQDNANFITVSGGLDSGFNPNIQAGGAKIDTNSYNIGIGVALQGTGVLTKSGSGTLNLNLANSYSGGTSVDGGTLSLNFDSTFQTNTAIGVKNSSNTVTINNGGTLTGTVNNWLSETNVASGGANAIAVVVNQGGILKGANGRITGLGNVTLNGGTIEVSSGLGGGTWNASFTLGGDITVSGSTASSITTSSGANTNANIYMANGSNGTGGTRTFTVNDVTSSAASDLVVSAQLARGTVIKAGAGTLELAAGATGTETAVSWQVNNGKLLVNANVSTGGVTVASGGTLAGSGTVGATTVNGTFAPGNSIGTLTIGGLLDLNGTSNFEIDPILGIGLNRASDLASASGAISYGGILNVLYGGSSSDFTNGMVFNLFDATTFTDSFSAINLPTLTGGLSWENNLLTTGTLTVIPEPGAALLGGLGMLALLRRRR